MITKKQTLKVLFWIPRILVILIAIFLSLIAFDALPSMVNFVLSLIPAVVVVGFLYLTWHKEQIAGTVFLVLGIVSFFYFDAFTNIWIITAVNFLIIAFLFLLEYYLKKK